MRIDEHFITPKVLERARNIAAKTVKRGWIVNPDEKIFAVAIKGLVNNGGDCPSKENSVITNKRCPCLSYRVRNLCFCKLYVRNDIEI